MWKKKISKKRRGFLCLREKDSEMKWKPRKMNRIKNEGDKKKGTASVLKKMERGCCCFRDEAKEHDVDLQGSMSLASGRVYEYI